MTAYILRRLLATIPVMVVVALFVFLLLHLTPGDPAAIIAGDDASTGGDRRHPQQARPRPAAVGAVRRLGLDLLHGDLGTSIFSNLPVLTLIRQRLEPTVVLAITTIVFAVVSRCRWASSRPGGPHADRPGRHGLLGARLLGAGVRRRLPADLRLRDPAALAAGAGLSAARRTGSSARCGHRAPRVALGLAYMALIARITRATMLEVLSEDYIRTARAKGVATRRCCCATR